MKAGIVPVLVLLVMLGGCQGLPGSGDGGTTGAGVGALEDGPGSTEAVDRIGADKAYLVNTDHREDFQLNSNVAVTPGGRVVVVWESKGVDGDGYGIFARFYGEDRRAVTGEVQVNVHTDDHQKDPDVAVLTNGNVVIAWESWYQERDDGYEVYARVFDAEGHPETDEIRLNTNTVDYQRDASVAPMPDGGFVAAWLSWDDEVEGYRTDAQRFDETGGMIGEPVSLDDAVVSTERIPGVEADAKEVDLEYSSEDELMGVGTDEDGNVVVVWRGYDEQTEAEPIEYQRLDHELGVISEPRRVDPSQDIQYEPNLDVAPNGAFVVAWHNGASTDDEIEAFARTFDSEGEPMIETVQLNSYTDNWQNFPVVAMLPDGRFAAAWESNGQDGDRTGIFFRRFQADGTPVGPEQQVNTDSRSWQEEIDIGIDQEGNAVVTFMTNKGDRVIDDIFARYFPHPA